MGVKKYYASKREKMVARFMEKEEDAKRKHSNNTPKGRGETVSFNFLLQAQKQHAVRKAISSFFLGARGRAVVLGGIDSRFHVGKIRYHRALRRVSGNWVLEMDSFKAHGVEVCQPKCLGLIDSGTTAMVVPSVSAMQILGSQGRRMSFRAAAACKGEATFNIEGTKYRLPHDQWVAASHPWVHV